MGLKLTKGNGQYAPLGHTYYLDDAIMAVAEKAELLYIRSLAFSAGSDADGFLTERQVPSFGINLSGLSARVDALTKEGLWVPEDGGFQIRAWLKWNKSAEEIGRYRKQDRERKRGGHDEAA